jgi:hypothetical protein
MDLQQRESRSFGHGSTVRPFGLISHRFFAGWASFQRIRPGVALYWTAFVAISEERFNIFVKTRTEPKALGPLCYLSITPERSGIAA